MKDNVEQSETPADPKDQVDGLLTAREISLAKGMIEVQQSHAKRCDRFGNRTMAVKQKGWDMERVVLLQKVLKVMGS